MADAVNRMSAALGLAKEFECRLMVTARTCAWEGNVEAMDMESCAREVQEMLENGEISNGDDGIEGDEILYIRERGERGEINWDEDEIDIDLRSKNEPFSWLACELVKELAKAPMNLNGHLDLWIEKARKPLEKHDG